MIEIKSAAPDTAVKLCEQVGVAADTVLTMTERDALLGFVCLSYSGEEVTLMHLQAPDTALTDALLRAALNTARTSGAKIAAVTDETLATHMRRKGYVTDSGPVQVEIANFFAKSSCNA